jgi:hypothetical protein
MNFRYLKRNLIIVIIYTLVCYVILIPFKKFITGISISILFGVFFGFLNEIITQLKKINEKLKTEYNINKVIYPKN